MIKGYKFYGYLLIIGALVQIITSLIWTFSDLYKWEGIVYEYIYLFGQKFGELCYLLVALRFFKLLRDAFLYLKKIRGKINYNPTFTNTLWIVSGTIVDLCVNDVIDIMAKTCFDFNVWKLSTAIFLILMIGVRIRLLNKKIKDNEKNNDGNFDDYFIHYIKSTIKGQHKNTSR